MAEVRAVLAEAQDMIAAGAVGDVLDETLRHASELFAIVDQEAADYPDIRDAAQLLRERLEQVRH